MHIWNNGSLERKSLTVKAVIRKLF